MTSTKDKGDVLEQVVAWLHEAPGVTVRHDVRLPMLGSRRNTRQFDVLLTSHIAGHEVRLAVECKNEVGRVGSPKIDSFRGKLEAVGIPPSLGIYVAPHGYTEGALEAARAAGIRALVVQGLSPDRLSLEVAQAFQSVVVLVPEVVALNVVNDLAEPIAEIGEAFLFYDGHGEPAGTVADFVWEAWLGGDLASRLDTTYLTLDLPDGWHNVIDGRRQDIRALGVTVKIVAMVMTFEGEARQAALVGADDGALVRGGMTGTFDPPAGRYRLLAFETEAELKNHLASRGLMHIVHRIKSPRIQFWNTMFWPPSQRVTDIIAERMQAFADGTIPDPRPFSFEQLEGTDLSAAWEPITEEYLAAWREKEYIRDGGSG
ncbi:MAG: restriction endonuclease [Chloroflexi bacterium]|nr:restriction endonuclease [Chloroflexota bacterium]